FETRARLPDGRELRFDVFIEGNDKAVAIQHLRGWLAARGLAGPGIEEQHCLFCHRQIPGPEVAAAVRQHGFFINQLK
ncbi:MAG: DUF2024 family protein, partial [Spongiibacteraceae bacterium]|nr:DUF2024 family protein [Spongiibacteraceae bacterium]